MKKKNLIVGIAQIVLSVGIFCGVGAAYYFSQLEADCAKANYAIQQKQAEALQGFAVQLQGALAEHEKVLTNLDKVLVPLKNSIDTIVSLRDYTIMKKRPVYALGNSFANFQKSLNDVKTSLYKARFSFNRNFRLSHENLITANKNYIAALKAVPMECLKADSAESAQSKLENKYEQYIFFCFLGMFFLAGLGLLSIGIQNCIRND